MRTRLSAEVGQHAPTTSHQRSHPRQVVGPRCSTCSRIDAHASAAFDAQTLAASTSLPVRVTQRDNSSIVHRSFAETTSRPPVLSFPCCIHHGRMRPTRLPRASGLSAPRVGRECGSPARVTAHVKFNELLMMRSLH